MNKSDIPILRLIAQARRRTQFYVDILKMKRKIEKEMQEHPEKFVLPHFNVTQDEKMIFALKSRYELKD
jgi:hypothetical protein